MRRAHFKNVVEIVSSGTPCGVTYLLNILLELEYLIYTGSYSLFWPKDFGGQAQANPLLRMKFGVWMPALLEKQTFNSTEDLVFRWSHEWPVPQRANVKRILFVRDPRDALYSQYKRLGRKEPLTDFLSKERVAPLGTHRIAKWAIQKMLWVRLSRPEDFLVVRFEDIKADPLQVMRGILDFCGGHRAEERVISAIGLSDTSRVKKLHDERSVKEVVIRKGMSFEWKSAPHREDLPLYERGYIQTALEQFGYENTAPRSFSPPLTNEHASQSRHWLGALYGSPGRFGPEASSKVLGVALDCLKQEEAGALTGAPMGISFTARLKMRTGYFCVGIFGATILWKMGKRFFPPLASFIEKKIMSYPLGER